jgi:hypothetical protein
MAAMDGTAEMAGMAVDTADLTAAAALAAGEVRGAAVAAATVDMAIETTNPKQKRRCDFSQRRSQNFTA